MNYASKRLSTKQPKTPKQRFSNKRRTIIVSSIIAATVLLIGGYVVYSIISWDAAQTTAKTTRTEVKQAIDAAFGSAKAPENSEVALTKITDTYRASSVGDHCDVPFIVQWQSVLWLTKSATENCQNEQQQAKETLVALDALKTFTVDSNMIAKRFVATSKAATEKKLDFAAAKAAWESGVTNIETQSVSQPVLEIRTLAVDASKGIIAAYTAVQDAEKAQDRTKYDAAIADLGKAYDATSQITVLSKTKYTTLLKTFTDAYQKL